VFQTKFESGNFYPTSFTENSPKKFNVEKEEPFLTNMIQSLMSELDKKNENNSNFSPDRKKYKRRKPFKPRPDFSGGGQSVDIVVRDQNTQRRPSVNNNRRPSSSPSDNIADNGPFSRYPVRIPPNTRNPHFSLPIDSLTGFVNKPVQRISGRTGGGDNISFEEQLSKMMKELEMRGESKNKTPEVLVNVWENVGGEMKLTEQKPIKRSQFDTMQQLQDFSYFTNDL